MTSQRRLAGLAVTLAVVVAGCSGGHGSSNATSTKLTGLFKITPGACATAKGKPTGSYLVVISAAAGKTVGNKHGGCVNPAYTLLRPGADGGLVTGEFQDVSGAAFDSHGNGRANRIVVPTAFGSRRFGIATNTHDQQGAANGQPAYPRPAAIATGSSLRVDLRSLVITYGGPASSTCEQAFGVGCWELGSENATGTYDATSAHYLINWFSGESFTAKGDSIEVHLEGTFVPQSG
ncbi:MAG TPA: hypothetical protein VHV76_11075 [Mycobacteriales bacterium]|nr:hypothetical protein [Mycobacteriales bacterium]